MRSAAARPASCTARRLEAGSSAAGSADRRSPRQPRTHRVPRQSSGIRRACGATRPRAGQARKGLRGDGAGSRTARTHRASTRAGASSRRCYTGRLPALPSRLLSRVAPAGEADSDQRKGGLGNSGCVRNFAHARSGPARRGQEEIIKRARELVEKANGKWVRHDVWGRRRLAYQIAHKGEGSYPLLNFDADAETLAELSRILRITDGVMRHLAVRRVEGSAGAPPPPEPEASQSVPEPAYAEANIRSEEEVEHGWRYQPRHHRWTPTRHPELAICRPGRPVAQAGRRGQRSTEGRSRQLDRKPNFFDVKVFGNQADALNNIWPRAAVSEWTDASTGLHGKRRTAQSVRRSSRRSVRAVPRQPRGSRGWWRR